MSYTLYNSITCKPVETSSSLPEGFGFPVILQDEEHYWKEDSYGDRFKGKKYAIVGEKGHVYAQGLDAEIASMMLDELRIHHEDLIQAVFDDEVVSQCPFCGEMTWRHGWCSNCQRNEVS